MTSNSFYGTYLGNAGALDQGNPNPLIASDPSFQIPQRGIRGMSPEDIKMLKQWDPKSADEIERIRYGMPAGGIKLPLAQGFAGDIGNMAGMAVMSGMEGAQLAGGITPKGGFNLFNLFNLKDNVNKTLNTGASPTTPAGQMINGMKRNRDQYEQLRQQGIL